MAKTILDIIACSLALMVFSMILGIFLYFVVLYIKAVKLWIYEMKEMIKGE